VSQIMALAIHAGRRMQFSADGYADQRILRDLSDAVDAVLARRDD